MEERLVAVRKGIQSEYEIAKAKFDNLDKALAGISSSCNEWNKEKRVAMSNLESERFIYKKLEEHVRKEIDLLQAPTRNPVEIIKQAESEL